MKRALPIIAAFLIVIATGLVHGLTTGRWHTSHRLEQAVARLDRVPRTLGAWEGKDGSLSQQEKTIGSIDGAVVRRYTNRATGKQVTVMLICGQQGPISVHPPEVCFAGVGWNFEDEPSHYTAEILGVPHSIDFKKAHLSRVDHGVPMHMDLFWAWSADGTWSAPANPRLTFAGQEALYKLYVSHVHAPTEADDDRSAVRDFLPLLLPQLQQALFTN